MNYLVVPWKRKATQTIINYCSTCGSPVRPRVPPGDDRPRYVCDSCDTIHYENPSTLFDLTHVHQVYLIFRARLLDEHYVAGEETADVKLFEEKEMPWDEIAFPSIEKALRLYFRDRPTGVFPLHMGTILPLRRLSSADLRRQKIALSITRCIL